MMHPEFTKWLSKQRYILLSSNDNGTWWEVDIHNEDWGVTWGFLMKVYKNAS